MATKGYDETSVIRFFKRNREISINSSTKTIYMIKNTTNTGNGTIGRLNYLTKYCGYVLQYCDKLIRNNKVITKNAVEDVIPDIKHNRDKCNIIDMTNANLRRNKMK